MLLGSDYPFDMGNLDCVAKVEQLTVDDARREVILSGAAKAMLKIS